MREFYLAEKGIYYKTNTFLAGRPTLVFIHGLSGSSSSWFLYENIFEKKYNLLTFDIRGHGKSEKSPEYYDYEIKNLANDLHHLILHLNISNFILISHSFGTLIALEYIKHHQERVNANILLSPIVDLNKKLSGKILRFILKLSYIFNLLPFKPKPGRHIDYSKYLQTTDWDLKRISVDVPNTTWRVYTYCLKHSMDPAQEYHLEKIKTPTLIVQGLKDTMAPAPNAIILSKKIQDSELLLIPDTDHFAIFKNIDEVTKAIDVFIKKIKKNLTFH